MSFLLLLGLLASGVMMGAGACLYLRLEEIDRGLQATRLTHEKEIAPLIDASLACAWTTLLPHMQTSSWRGMESIRARGP